jgi:hypothetical protein
MTGVATALVTVLWVTMAFTLTGGDVRGGLFWGAIGGVAAAIYFRMNKENDESALVELARSIGEISNVKANPLTPRASWRSSFIVAVVFAPVLAILGGFLVGGLVPAFADNPFELWVLEGWAFVGLFVAVAAIPACALAATPTWPASLTFLQLRFSQHTPLHLMRFFEDARERGVLRTVGPVYQFRHARLQDRLAEKASTPVSTNDPSESTAA